jgi:hypothetical protein
MLKEVPSPASGRGEKTDVVQGWDVIPATASEYITCWDYIPAYLPYRAVPSHR